MRSKVSRPGYTWVELLVTVGVIFFLAALLLPGIQQARTPGRGNVCRSNMYNVGIAMQNLLSSKREYPGYLDSLPLASAPRDTTDPAELQRVTWVVPLLPYLERADLYPAYRQGDYLDPNASPDTQDPRTIYLDWLTCPSDPGLREWLDRHESGKNRSGAPPPCSYVVNTGRADVYASASASDRLAHSGDWRANGVFFNRYVDGVANPAGAPIVTMTHDYITAHDGSSLTIMFSERLDAGSYSFPADRALDVEAAIGFVWWPSASSSPSFKPPFPSQRINGPADRVAIRRARPSSGHPLGVNVAFCDGHTRFISEDIDYGVWCKLMTPNDAQCRAPGDAVLTPAGKSNNYDYLRGPPVDESDIE